MHHRPESSWQRRTDCVGPGFEIENLQILPGSTTQVLLYSGGKRSTVQNWRNAINICQVGLDM